MRTSSDRVVSLSARLILARSRSRRLLRSLAGWAVELRRLGLSPLRCGASALRTLTSNSLVIPASSSNVTLASSTTMSSFLDFRLRGGGVSSLVRGAAGGGERERIAAVITPRSLRLATSTTDSHLRHRHGARDGLRPRTDRCEDDSSFINWEQLVVKTIRLG